MKILKQNTGEKLVPIAKYHVYIYVTDTKDKFFLKEIKLGPGHYTWEWISLRSDRFVDLAEINDRYCSFDHAINTAVNDAYSTVYEFETYEEMVTNWDEICYVDNIKTIYKSEKD